MSCALKSFHLIQSYGATEIPPNISPYIHLLTASSSLYKAIRPDMIPMAIGLLRYITKYEFRRAIENRIGEPYQKCLEAVARINAGPATNEDIRIYDTNLSAVVATLCEMVGMPIMKLHPAQSDVKMYDAVEKAATLTVPVLNEKSTDMFRIAAMFFIQSLPGINDFFDDEGHNKVRAIYYGDDHEAVDSLLANGYPVGPEIVVLHPDLVQKYGV